MMSKYQRFQQAILKDEFCQRLEQLNATNVTPDMIRRLANYLSLNEKNKQLIYLSTWQHHIKRVSTAFNVPQQAILPAICSKMLQNETVFRSMVDTIGLLKQKRDEEKFIDLADLRTVLKKFGVNYNNQNMFLNSFTKGVKVHIEDLVTLMKACVQKQYGKSVQELKNQVDGEDQSEDQRISVAGVQDLESVQGTDYFSLISKKLRASCRDEGVDELRKVFQQFDAAETGFIKAYYLVGAIKQYVEEAISDQELLGLQFELESLSYDGTVDYEEFIRLFLAPETTSKRLKDEKLKLDVKKSPYSI